MSAIGLGGGGSYGGGGGADKGLGLPLAETLRLAWADPELRSRILFVLFMFGVFTLGVHIPVPIPGVNGEEAFAKLQNLPAMAILNIFGGGALRRLSIFSLGLNPYITASIIMQILQTALPNMKKEMQEGGEYARKQQNKRTRVLTLFLCVFQSIGFLQMMAMALPDAITMAVRIEIIIFWTAGAMFMLWLGEQISERGIGNGVSLMIFAGIILSLPYQVQQLQGGVRAGAVHWWSFLIVIAIFVCATWFIVYFTIAQRRIPIQHMRRQIGTRVMGGSTSYLPLSVNMAGVLPIIFAVSFISLPYTFGSMLGGDRQPNPQPLGYFLIQLGTYLSPSGQGLIAPWLPLPRAIVGSIIYTALIFLFTYFWIAIQYNVEDISNNLKRGGSFIPGVRPGKQTKDFLDGVISRVTLVGAAFIAVVALLNYIAPWIARLPANSYISVIGGTSLLIIVQVALETMRQVEANLLMKQYGS
ncbi:MAG TPA: preprotein translocase subunit SecY [Fimbriimonas sp.]|nr:preprotein translocase subunit SecY [Fimbriimonas sp.]